MSADLATRESLPALVACYQQAEEEVRQAYDLLEAAEKRLKSGFMDLGGHCFSTNPRDYCKVGSQAADLVMETLKTEAWRVIVERMELRRVLSVKRRKELDTQLQNGDKLPDWVFRLKPTTVPAGCRPAFRFDGDRHSGRKPTAVPVQADRLFMM